MTITELREQQHRVLNEIDKLYWLFYRTARGKPPVLVNPSLYEKLAKIEHEMNYHRLAKIYQGYYDD